MLVRSVEPLNKVHLTPDQHITTTVATQPCVSPLFALFGGAGAVPQYLVNLPALFDDWRAWLLVQCSAKMYWRHSRTSC